MVTVWRESVTIVRIRRGFETKMSVTLSKEQAAVLLPLLPNLAGLVAAAQPGTANGGGVQQQEPSYSISEMFEKKKKNTRSTFAQNYLLVSILCVHVASYCF